MLIARISILLTTFLQTSILLELHVTVIQPLSSSVSLNLARTFDLLKKKRNLWWQSFQTCTVSWLIHLCLSIIQLYHNCSWEMILDVLMIELMECVLNDMNIFTQTLICLILKVVKVDRINMNLSMNFLIRSMRWELILKPLEQNFDQDMHPKNSRNGLQWMKWSGVLLYLKLRDILLIMKVHVALMGMSMVTSFHTYFKSTMLCLMKISQFLNLRVKIWEEIPFMKEMLN